MNERRDAAATLREQFDRGFALPIAEKPALLGLLSIRVGGDPYALRISEIAGLHGDKTVAPAAGSRPGFLGMAGFRGVVSPVYDLGVLLGYARGESTRFLVLVKGAAPVALAFEGFAGHFHVAAERVSEGSSSTRPYLDGVVEGPTGTHALIRLASITEAIVRGARSGPPEER